MSNYSDLFHFFIFKPYVHCSYGTRNDMHLVDIAKTKPKINNYKQKKYLLPIPPTQPICVAEEPKLKEGTVWVSDLGSRARGSGQRGGEERIQAGGVKRQRKWGHSRGKSCGGGANELIQVNEYLMVRPERGLGAQVSDSLEEAGSLVGDKRQ